MNSLIEILKEQSAFGFTGKINVLSSTNGQFLGVVYQQEGFLVGAQTQDLVAKKALMKLIFDDVDSAQNFKFVVEPEVLSPNHFMMKVSLEEVKEEAQKFYQRYRDLQKLKPAAHLRLMIDPEIIVSKDELNSQEFDTLLILTEWSKVSDIYKNSNLMDFEVTDALVSLRKKRAIKVFQN